MGGGPVLAVPVYQRLDAHDRGHGARRTTSSAAARTISSLQSTGVDGGVWCGDGSPADYGLDQRFEDGSSLCWDTAPLSERVEILGKGEAHLEVSVDKPWALVAVRVCDVAPDGASTLIARGLLNLSRREGHDRSVPMPVDEPVLVRVPLQATAYAIPAGHRIRLAVSNTYWPMAWPSPEATRLTVHCGPREHVDAAAEEPGATSTRLSRPSGHRRRAPHCLPRSRDSVRAAAAFAGAFMMGRPRSSSTGTAPASGSSPRTPR